MVNLSARALAEFEGLERALASAKEALARALELKRQAEEMCTRRTQEREELLALLIAVYPSINRNATPNELLERIEAVL